MIASHAPRHVRLGAGLAAVVPVAAVVLVAVVVIAVSLPAVAREVIPAPPGGGPGVSLFPQDQQGVLDLPAPADRDPYREPTVPASDPATGGRDPDLGGDDITVMDCVAGYEGDIAIASDGTLFAIVMWDNDDNHYRFTIRRSLDGGTTWSTWATFYNSTTGYRYWDPRILVAEGDVDRVIVAYTLDPANGGPTEVHMAWSPLDLPAANFGHDTVIATCAENWIMGVSIATDAGSFDDYYLYATWSATNDATGHDIYFARSTDQGGSWETPYVIATIAVTDRGYYNPTIAYGFGGRVHVAWYLGFPSDHEYDGALRYRCATGSASGGLASWGTMESLTSHTDNVDQFSATIGASRESTHVMVASRRIRHDDDADLGVATLSSANGGVDWTGVTVVGSGNVLVGNVLYQAASDRWLIGLNESGDNGYRAAPVASPASWSALQVASDGYYFWRPPYLVLDPSHDDRIGLLCRRSITGGYRYLFDAEWRADPGYPNLDPGFPVTLADAPISDPALADLDGDGDLEIVFTDEGNRIRVYRPSSSPLPGWPVLVPTPLSPAPVAIGDMDGDGDREILVGTADGRVYGYDATGHLLPGFPFNSGHAAPAYVTIASLGGDYPRAAVVAADNWVGCISHLGTAFPGSYTHAITGRTVTSTPAVGDIDGDGRAEIVVAASQTVWAFQRDVGPTELVHNLETTISGGISLADFDLDGEVEIVAPLANGVVHVLQENGTEFAGSWPATVATSSLRGAAIADLRLLANPEVAVTATNWSVSLLNTSGSVVTGWPADTDGWIIYGKPVLGRVLGTVSDVIVGARGYRGWAWDTNATLIDGWPRTFDDHIQLTPAYGDLDLDGRAEVVFLTTAQLAVVDVGTAVGSSRGLWPMAAHDAQRTGCWECTEQLVPVAEATDGITQVSFANPWPNPVAGPTTFAYELPVAACVELAVYDLRGRRVALVDRAEQPAGRYQLTWNGHDRDGRPLASGHYLASLSVKGPGVEETLVRKFVVVH